MTSTTGSTRSRRCSPPGDPPVGFVSVDVVDGCAHIDQLSVLAEHGGRGTGRALLDRAVRWARDAGLGAVTLTAFRDVPWNAPFYRRAGFEVVDDPSPGLAALRAAERAEGLDRFGPRVRHAPGALTDRQPPSRGRSRAHSVASSWAHDT